MTLLVAAGALFIGMAVGGLLVWLHQTDARARFRQEIEGEIKQALYGRRRRSMKYASLL
jgi:CHASE1-domain containing sensor protein